MTSLSVLLVPIVLSAVIVFIASSIIHMVLPYHRNDFQRAPDEDALMRSMRSAGLAPGEYTIPYASTPKEMGEPEYVAKATEGPVAIITVGPSGPPSMGKPLALWFGLCLLISVVAGYVAGRALGPGAEYLDVFRFAGTTAFAGYVLGTLQPSIWLGRPWGTTLKSSLDGVIYALLTAGMFGAFWPG